MRHPHLASRVWLAVRLSLVQLSNTNRKGKQLGGPVRQDQARDFASYKMTLCGSEVPQDRWRGRTAGSGMWTLTRESVLGAPCGDSAIPYG